MPIGVDTQGNIVHLPYGPYQGTVPTAVNKLKGTPIARDESVQDQQIALARLALNKLGNHDLPPGLDIDSDAGNEPDADTDDYR